MPWTDAGQSDLDRQEARVVEDDYELAERMKCGPGQLHAERRCSNGLRLNKCQPPFLRHRGRHYRSRKAISPG